MIARTDSRCDGAVIAVVFSTSSIIPWTITGQRVMAVCWAIDPSIDVHTAATGLGVGIAESIATGYSLKQQQKELDMIDAQSKGGFTGFYDWSAS